MCLKHNEYIMLLSVCVICFFSPSVAQVPDDEQFVPDFQSDNCKYLFLNIYTAGKFKTSFLRIIVTQFGLEHVKSMAQIFFLFL